MKRYFLRVFFFFNQEIESDLTQMIHFNRLFLWKQGPGPGHLGVPGVSDQQRTVGWMKPHCPFT